MRQNGKPSNGFTLIEVLIALVVFMVAMLGLISFQRASISGANMGREQTAAVNLARYVMTWLEDEAAAWPLLNTATVPSATDMPMLNKGLGAPDTWLTLPDTAATTRFDAYIEPSTSSLYSGTGATDSAPYCVGYRVKPLGDSDDVTAYQVWVRVTWPRWGQYGNSAWDSCDGTRLTATETDAFGKLQVVELTGIVSREFTSGWEP
jgi:prepilin-type N-terminal cleavage/methylation domain-containing protein